MASFRENQSQGRHADSAHPNEVNVLLGLDRIGQGEST
ncbi:hypothetical protein SynSYN20_00028 [Synechococcus sp. SYN20]|nr:hypothetical protein SynMVIR181_00029 [Synechococcus sp. MVIR-18-1]QNJ24390.1 hypothetical protein SynSYN20_00028 [Synechococcus sp. SYN20]